MQRGGDFRPCSFGGVLTSLTLSAAAENQSGPKDPGGEGPRNPSVDPSLTSPDASESGGTPTPAPDRWGQERTAMVERQLKGRGIQDPRVLSAMERVPRHEFVPMAQRQEAYSDRPLSIGQGQTISQPYIVAFMTAAAKPNASARCLEIGTGSGYQAAVLSELCAATYSIEYLPDVAQLGRQNLKRAGYGDRVHLRVGDGYNGWPEAAPFDVIVVTAAPEAPPAPLLEQLGMGGRLLVPIGLEDGEQELEQWTRIGAGGAESESFKRERLMSVRFVPFLGEPAR